VRAVRKSSAIYLCQYRRRFLRSFFVCSSLDILFLAIYRNYYVVSSRRVERVKAAREALSAFLFLPLQANAVLRQRYERASSSFASCWFRRRDSFALSRRSL
jgi:hypothetical protein